jgi:tight adherence protein C
LIVLILIGVFIATVLTVLGLLFLLESRKESLPQRVKDIVAPPTKSRLGVFRFVKEWLTGTWKRFQSRAPTKDEVLTLFLGGQLSGARLLLNKAGYRKPYSYTIYLWIRVGLPLLLVGIVIAAGKGWRFPARELSIMVMLALAAGILFPIHWLDAKVRRRREQIEDSLPDALDLLTVCVDAGLGLNSSIVKITEEFELSSPALSEEFDIVNREIMAGKPRGEAFRSLADRTGVEDVKSFVAMLIQTEKLGTSLSQSLRVHSDSLRTRRRQRAEEAAAKTTIKLIFPLVLLMFPALFIVMLGPGIIQVYRILLSTTLK